MLDYSASTLSATLSLGFVLGIRHATEPDHVVAVSTIVSEHKNAWRSALVGALWGLGHSLALLVAGLVLLAIRCHITETLGACLETGVALMIVILGIGVLRRLLRDRTIHIHAHEHGGHPHIHLHSHTHGHEHEHAHPHGATAWKLKPIMVGIMHGLAGSGALTIMVMQKMPSLATGLLYVVVFGAGTVVGMWTMGGLLSLPLNVVAGRYERAQRALHAVVGVGSVAFGIYYGFSVWLGA